MNGRTGHEISHEVDAAVREVDRAAEALKVALATLAHVWNMPGITLKERRIMTAAGKRARRSAT